MNNQLLYFLLLLWLGQAKMKDAYILLTNYASIYYFVFFIFLIPIIGVIETHLAFYKTR